MLRFPASNLKLRVFVIIRCDLCEPVMRGCYRYQVMDWAPGVRIPEGEGIFLFSETSRRILGPHSPLLSGYRSSFPGVKLSGHDADHSPLSSDEVKNVYASMAGTGTTLNLLTLLFYLKYLEFSCVSV